MRNITIARRRQGDVVTLTVTVSPSRGTKVELQCNRPATFQKMAASNWFLKWPLEGLKRPSNTAWQRVPGRICPLDSARER